MTNSARIEKLSSHTAMISGECRAANLHNRTLMNGNADGLV
jgi:flagellar biosynthesis/type III secretory pathway chaperone